MHSSVARARPIQNPPTERSNAVTHRPVCGVTPGGTSSAADESVILSGVTQQLQNAIRLRSWISRRSRSTGRCSARSSGRCTASSGRDARRRVRVEPACRRPGSAFWTISATSSACRVRARASPCTVDARPLIEARRLSKPARSSRTCRGCRVHIPEPSSEIVAANITSRRMAVIGMSTDNGGLIGIEIAGIGDEHWSPMTRLQS